MSQDRWKVPENLIICKPHDSQIHRAKDLITVAIALGLCQMDEPIYLHGEAGGRAVEIDDEPIDDLLASEVSVLKAMMPKTVPQNKLGLRHLLSESSSSLT